MANIETYCNLQCNFNEGGICRCNWLRIYEGKCDCYEWNGLEKEKGAKQNEYD